MPRFSNLVLSQTESGGRISQIGESRNYISCENLKVGSSHCIPVVKKNGSVRVCGDLKTTFNQASVTEYYPLPRIGELFKLDLSNAYLQLPLAESSKEFLTIISHMGLHRFNRLPFGVASAPAIFQRTMETLLRGLRGVSVYLDDILITGATVAEHLENLERVLERLAEAGLRLDQDKCSFLLKRIEYLGHVIDALGLHRTEEKIKAIKNASTKEYYQTMFVLRYYRSSCQHGHLNWHLCTVCGSTEVDGPSPYANLTCDQWFTWRCVHLMVMDHLSTTPISCANIQQGPSSFSSSTLCPARVLFH